MKQHFRAPTKQGISPVDIIFTCTLLFGLFLVYLYGATTLSHSAVRDHRAAIINITDKTLIAGSLYKVYGEKKHNSH